MRRYVRRQIERIDRFDKRPAAEGLRRGGASHRTRFAEDRFLSGASTPIVRESSLEAGTAGAMLRRHYRVCPYTARARARACERILNENFSEVMTESLGVVHYECGVSFTRAPGIYFRENSSRRRIPISDRRSQTISEEAEPIAFTI